METTADTQATADELGRPRPLPAPQTAALSVPADVQDGPNALAAPPQPSIGQTMAQSTIAAGQVNHGDAQDWAENAVSGVQAALAGFGAAGKVPPGAGALYGVGAAARQGQARADEQQKVKTEQNQRQQQIDIEKGRASEEKTEFDKDYQLKLAESARQQALQVKAFAMDDANLKFAQSRDAREVQQASDAHMEFVQKQSDYLWQLQQAQGHPATAGGAESPEFDHYGDAAAWSHANGLNGDSHGGFIYRPVLLPNGKSQVWEVPDKRADWTKLKDANGKTYSGFVDPLGAMATEHQMAETRQLNAKSNLDEADAEAKRALLKDDETIKGARLALDKATAPDGTIDRNRMQPGQIEQVRKAYLEQWRTADAVVAANERQLKTDDGYFDAQTDPVKMKALEDEYGVTDAKAKRDESSRIVTQLDGSAYKPKAIPTSDLPKPGAPGMVITKEAFAPYLRASGGDVQKAKIAAKAAGWGDPGPAQNSTSVADAESALASGIRQGANAGK